MAPHPSKPITRPIIQYIAEVGGVMKGEIVGELLEHIPAARDRKHVGQSLSYLSKSGQIKVTKRNGISMAEIKLVNMPEPELINMNGTAIVPRNPLDRIESGHELRGLVNTQAHRIHELEQIIAEMEPYLRRIDVYEYIMKGRV